MSKVTSAKLIVRRAALLAAVCGAALVSCVPADASSPPVVAGPLVKVTGPSPFRNCTADKVAEQETDGSIVYHGSEVEPYIDVNPKRPLNLVTVWQQDRWSDGGARGLASAVSEDGGAHWAT